MSAEVLEIPVRIRCDHVAREMREGVIGVLNEIHRHVGDAAFHRAARDLVASVAAIVAHVEGRQGVLDISMLLTAHLRLTICQPYRNMVPEPLGFSRVGPSSQ